MAWVVISQTNRDRALGQALTQDFDLRIGYNRRPPGMEPERTMFWLATLLEPVGFSIFTSLVFTSLTT
jgi:hypothetical protein